MIVGDKVSHAAVSEAYCLLTSYIREEGKIGAKYDKDRIEAFVVFLAEILKHPENFINERNTQEDNSQSDQLQASGS